MVEKVEQKPLNFHAPETERQEQHGFLQNIVVSDCLFIYFLLFLLFLLLVMMVVSQYDETVTNKSG